MPHRRVSGSAADRSELTGTMEMTESTKTEPSLGAEEEDFSGEGSKDERAQEVNRDILEEYRVRAKKFMDLSLFGRMYENLFMAAAVFSGLEYIAATYDIYIPAEALSAFEEVEIALALAFGFDWILNFLIADNKIAFTSSFYSMIDLLTVIPIWLTRLYPCMNYNNIVTDFDRFIYILCATTTTRILRSLRIRRKLMRIEDEVTRCIADIALNIIVFILFFAALMQVLEQQDANDVSTYFANNREEFHSWCYYIVVTFSSVGYGDILPKSLLGRFLCMFMISFAFIMGPQMSSDLIEKMEEKSVYERAHFIKKTRKTTHVVVCGDLCTMALLPFVEELFHDDHEDEDINAVFLSPDPPSSTMRDILRKPLYALRVAFLQGSVLSEADLKRALVHEALAVFIMSNKFAEDPDNEDAKIILQQLSIKKYVMSDIKLEKPLIAMQLTRPENQRYLIDSTGIEGGKPKEDIVLCLNEIKMGFIAKAAMFPGSNILLMNLLTSFAYDDDDDDNGAPGGVDGDNPEIENLDNADGDDWTAEYKQGCGWEVYSSLMNPMFTGIHFAHLADMIYQKMGIVLFGLRVQDKNNKDKSHTRMLLNPADYPIPSQEHYDIEALVIAENKATSDLTFPEQQAGKEGTDHGMNVAGAMSAIASAMSGGGGGWAGSISKLQAVATAAEKHAQSSGALVNGGKASGSGGSSSSSSKSKKALPKEELPWQKLLHSHEVKVIEGLSTEQEINKRVDAEFLRANYYTLPGHGASLDACTIRTSVEIEAPFINQHTLIMGNKMSNLFDLIRPLRAMYLGFVRPIVIMSPVPIPDAVWQKVCVFQGVYYIHGSLLEEYDMVRAGALVASQCIVLADCSMMMELEAGGGGRSGPKAEGQGEENGEKKKGVTAGAKATIEALTDADAIFAYQMVRSLKSDIVCCIEIINPANVSFLDPQEGLLVGDIDYKFTPQFASGNVLTSSLLDTLICQAFYNRHIVSIIELFAAGVTVKDRSTIRAEVLAAGGGGAFEPEAKRGLAAIKGSSLYQVKVPESMYNQTYGELFTKFTQDGIVPLGLYRGVFSNLKVGPKGNKHPFVFTNPPKETELFSCDKVFVLSQKPMMGKRTVGKRTDWSLSRKNEISPIDQLFERIEGLQEQQRRRLGKVGAKLDDLLLAIHETFYPPSAGQEAGSS